MSSEVLQQESCMSYPFLSTQAHCCTLQPRKEKSPQVKLEALCAALPLPQWCFELVTNCDEVKLRSIIATLIMHIYMYG